MKNTYVKFPKQIVVTCHGDMLCDYTGGRVRLLPLARTLRRDYSRAARARLAKQRKEAEERTQADARAFKAFATDFGVNDLESYRECEFAFTRMLHARIASIEKGLPKAAQSKRNPRAEANEMSGKRRNRSKPSKKGLSRQIERSTKGGSDGIITTNGRSTTC